MQKKVVLWVALAVLLAAGYAIYRQRADALRLNVEPHAAEEIEKARRR